MITRAIIIFLVATILITTLLLDIYMFQLPDVAQPLGGKLTPAAEKALDIILQLTSMFVTFSIGILGGLAYFIKEHKPQGAYTRQELGLIVVSGVSAVLSIFFGHFAFSLPAEMLANDILDLHSASLMWSLRLQYMCVVVSVTALVLFVLEASLRKT